MEGGGGGGAAERVTIYIYVIIIIYNYIIITNKYIIIYNIKLHFLFGACRRSPLDFRCSATGTDSSPAPGSRDLAVERRILCQHDLGFRV